MMTGTRDRLFGFKLEHGVAENWDAVLRWYDLPRDGNAPLKATSFTVAPRDGYFVTKAINEKGLYPRMDGSISATLAGQFGGTTYVRVAYSHVERNPMRQVLRIHLIKVEGGRASLVPGGSTTLRAASPAGSMLEVVAVEPDHFDLPDGSVPRPVLYYWKETERTPPDGAPGDGWGKVTARGRMVRGLADWSEPFVLSRNPDGSERSWNAFALTGDYGRGAFFHHPHDGGKAYRYLAQWTETTFAAGRWTWVMHTNVVGVDP
jgi:hypothetical protein